jgi:hypothetical protein
MNRHAIATRATTRNAMTTAWSGIGTRA